MAAVLTAATLGVSIERDGIPYGGATDHSIVIQHVSGLVITDGGQDWSATQKGAWVLIDLQLDIWDSNPVSRDSLADKVLKAVEGGRTTFRSTYNMFDLRCVEFHDMADPETGPQLYRKVIRYQMKTPLTRVR